MGNPLLNMLNNNNNSPFNNLLNMVKSGGNPQTIINNIINTNPQLKPIMNIINGKNPNQLKETFYSMCKERGINPENLAKQYNINLPK